MRRQTLFLLFMILFSLPLTVLAQGTKTVKGTVVDQNNEPIIGATVVVKGSTIGAATDLDGNYVLNGVPEDATLVFNYLGMLPQEISAAGQSVINVKLREDAQLLEEVVVIGYGSAKAKDLTAPIDVVKEKELINVPTSSPMAALQGKVPGVNIINSGTPGEGFICCTVMAAMRGAGYVVLACGCFPDSRCYHVEIPEMAVLGGDGSVCLCLCGGAYNLYRLLNREKWK